MAGARKDPGAADGFPVGGPLAQRIQALGVGTVAAERTSRRVETDMAEMIRRFGLDPARLREVASLELLAAETRCASCRDVDRCHGYLDGAADRPEDFCPNAASFDELAREN
jgi:hypothetical protein